MYKWDKKWSERIHNFGQDKYDFWAFISEHGLWVFVVYAIWLGFIGGSINSLYPLFVSTLISFFGVLLLRQIIKRPRPSGEIKTKYKAALKWSFPSLHASIGFSMATSLAALVIAMTGGETISWFISLILLFFAGIISITRLFVGVHYLSDLLVGGLIGVLISVIIELL